MEDQPQSQLKQSLQRSQNKQSSLQQNHQSVGTQRKIRLSNNETDILYVGNLSEDINESDLYELFVFTQNKLSFVTTANTQLAGEAL